MVHFEKVKMLMLSQFILHGFELTISTKLCSFQNHFFSIFNGEKRNKFLYAILIDKFESIDDQFVRLNNTTGREWLVTTSFSPHSR